MRYADIRESVFRLRAAKMQMEMELEENGGEVTEEILSKEQMIEDVKNLIQNGGIDILGRLAKSVKQDIQNLKDEKAFIDRQSKKKESFLADILEVTDLALRECEMDKAKGERGYSFTSHTSVTTKADNKLIKELFFDEAEKVLRESGVIPEDVTFTLSASVSLLPEDAERPQWYNTTTTGKAILRSPKKDTSEDEFDYNEFM